MQQIIEWSFRYEIFPNQIFKMYGYKGPSYLLQSSFKKLRKNDKDNLRKYIISLTYKEK